MRKIVTVSLSVVLFSSIALADRWSGMLLDSSCYDRQKSADACMATSETTAFAFQTVGKVYKLDAAGNTKAATAIKNRADRTTPGQPAPKSINAVLEGSEKDGSIQVDSISIQ